MCITKNKKGETFPPTPDCVGWGIHAKNLDEILIGEIVNVCADESVITNGKIDPKKLKPITFDPCNSTYIALGDVVGKAFGDGLKLK